MKQLNKKECYINFAGLTSIGLFSLGYIIFVRPFAELHIQFSFLDFPVFIGEILIFVCFLLWFSKRILSQRKPDGKFWVVVLCYFSFVIIKALSGYMRLGPLAFRHAALFYYPIFILFACSFYDRELFKPEKTIFCFLIIIYLFITLKFDGSWILTCFGLAFIMSYMQHNKMVKYAMLIILMVVTPYRRIFATSRMMLVSNGIAMVYLVITLFLVLKIKKRFKAAICIVSILLIVSGIVLFSDRNALKSITNVSGIIEFYKAYDAQVSAYLAENEVESVNGVRIYDPEISTATLSYKRNDDLSMDEANLFARQVRLYNPDLYDSERISGDGQTKGQENKRIGISNPDLRNLGVAYANAAFRLFIWRDMIVDLWEKKPVFGFDFGIPLRPKSIIALNWAVIPFRQDGWLAAHNSYLHMIYRSGIVGIAFILVTFTVLFRMIVKSSRCKSVIGILLCGIIINWFVAANFLLIFELPYTAIPIWSLFGLTYAYTKELKPEILIKKEDKNE